jgi:radical SAM superfamily enzyme YgiQ (UPF0313 family)
MKILLVKPKPRLATIRALQPLIMLEPLELGYVAAGVGPGHDIRVLDLRLARRAERDLTRELARFNPDVIGLSGYTHESTIVKELACLARRQCPGARIVVGGHHATVLPGDYNRPEIFDAIVRGEGSGPFGAIVEALDGGRPLHGIENVMVPGGGFDARTAEQMPRYPDLADLPAPRRDLWDPAPYRCIWPSFDHPRGQTIFPPVALVRTSFGCLMECNFCVVPALSGRRHMTRPPEHVAAELKTIAQRHVYFCDDESFLHPHHALQLADAIERAGIEKRYFAWARSTTVLRHPELFERWRRIGLDAVFLGFEAITDADLDRLVKHASVADNERAHAMLTALGICVQAGFMVNASFSEAQFLALEAYVRRMPRAQVTFTVYTPSPGSASWQEERRRYVCDEFALHDCMHPLTPTTLPPRRFYKHFSWLTSIGSSKNPLRSPRTRMPVADVFRIIRATIGYSRALRRAHRDLKRWRAPAGGSG